MTRTVRTETRKRGFFGKLFKLAFILFNLAMAFWLVGYWMLLGEMDVSAAGAEAGRAIGGTIGTGLLFGLWVAGDIILGLLVLLTRGSKVIVEEAIQ
ncbi:hypothetical protein [Roseibium alexandrii]|uniref:Uncharacterized protein n=1 Tax=Roseibium alexandrii (strain DSM 17067 / NCIMB 14079 / DFL-11) TaxID=244592 RepID=A0A5E8UX03_ROSAD|nr:hypothetical protein [Roseibium alexandrii]RMX61774.1 hypothetical protein SADFL11_00011760 [Roseibium alexandrii DFL-11]